MEYVPCKIYGGAVCKNLHCVTQNAEAISLGRRRCEGFEEAKDVEDAWASLFSETGAGNEVFRYDVFCDG